MAVGAGIKERGAHAEILGHRWQAFTSNQIPLESTNTERQGAQVLDDPKTLKP